MKSLLSKVKRLDYEGDNKVFESYIAFIATLATSLNPTLHNGISEWKVETINGFSWEDGYNLNPETTLKDCLLYVANMD